MSERRHTPGPWYVSKSGTDRLIYADHQHAFDHAIVRNGGCDSETDANARLMAAAPELLAAVQAALPLVQLLAAKMNNPKNVADTTQAMFAVIENATGTAV